MTDTLEQLLWKKIIFPTKKNFKGEEITFIQLNHQETFDIDYLLYKGLCVDVFNEKNRLHGDSSGVLYKRTKMEKVYSASMKAVAVMGKIGNYYFGVPSISDESTSLNVIEVDRILKTNRLEGSHRPYFEIRQYLVDNFGDKEICIFNYGQKTNFSVIENILLELIESFEFVEIALATEYSVVFINISYKINF
jgi:hypothetical protein